MIGIVMAGGKGSRMNMPPEKLLLKYKKPVIFHVIDALVNSNCFSKILAITSSNSPITRKLLKEMNIEVFDTPGKSYVFDLNMVLKTMNDWVFVTSGDLPFLDGKIIKKIVKDFNPKNTCTAILVTKKFLNSLGLFSEYKINFEDKECCYTGISIINAKNIDSNESINENYVIVDDKRIAFNLNTKKDYELLGVT